MAPASPSAANLLSAALSAHQAGRFDEAANLYRRVIATNSRSDVAHHNLGLIDHAQGRLAEAAASIARALEINPKSAVYLSNMASVHQAQAKPEDAIGFAERALALQPGLAAAHNTLGLAYTDLSKDEEAESSLLEALRIEPRYVDALTNLARLRLRQDRAPEAQKLTESAIRLRPDRAKTYVLFGDILMAQELSAGATESYRRAIALGLDTAELNAKLGTALSASGDAIEARHRLERAVSLEPGVWSSHWAIGSFLLHHAELDSAAEAIRVALSLGPGRPELLAALARAVPHGSADDDDVRALKSAYAASSPMSEARMHLAFGLAKVSEELKDYAASFAFAAEANAYRRSTFTYATETDAAVFAGLAQVFTPAFLTANAGRGLESDLPVFIIGMPRSGTTLTEQILASHPDVFGAGELQFMEAAARLVVHFNLVTEPGRLMDEAHPLDLAEIAKIYLSWLPKTIEGKRRVTDKMPQNFLMAGLIHLAFPNARIIHVRRSPLDNCLSIFKNYFSADGLHFAYDLTELGRYYNLYRGLMRHWNRVMPGVIHDVQYEDLVSSPETTGRAMFDYCGLDWRPEVLDFHLNKREIKTASFAQVRRPIYTDSVNLAARYGDRLQPLIDALAEWTDDSAAG